MTPQKNKLKAKAGGPKNNSVYKKKRIKEFSI